MARWRRIATAATLAIALSAVPAVLDQCTDDCQAHVPGISTPPVCHHDRSTGPHIGHAPAACNHDHSASIGALPAPPAAPHHAADALAAAATSTRTADCDSRIIPSTHAPPRSPGVTHACTLPLRV
jgi:hypothetical protein